MLGFVVLVPAVAGLVCFAVPWNRPRRALLVAAAAAHSGLVAASLARPPGAWLGGWIGLDATSSLFLAITSFLFLLVSFYTVGYLARESRRNLSRPGEEPPFVNFPEATFTGCYLLFLAAMSLVVLSRHWGLMWVAVEATTLASAPLIYFHRYPKSLEATWKYLMICSVGIALALLGNFFLAMATKTGHGEHVYLAFADLERHAGQLDPLWLKAAFLLLLVGYGTKMGLAPMHTWLPDAHSEAPSMVSALLSGVLLNCAFLAILRGHSLLVRAGLGDFSRQLLVIFGLGSMAVAGLFIIRQMDFKRLLAYSSVEHMGILVLGVGIGGVAGFGSMLHAVNHSVAKAMLFLAAGNTLGYFHTKSTLLARGTLRVLPVTGALWIVGLLAITGSPPFGAFLSELAILRGILDGEHTLVAVLYLAALSIVFVGMSAVVLPIVYGVPAASEPEKADAAVPREAAPESEPPVPAAEPLWSLGPPLLLAAAAVVLGLWLPGGLTDLLHRAAAAVGAE
jgi:hydrogenase-4 component F